MSEVGGRSGGDKRRSEGEAEEGEPEREGEKRGGQGEGASAVVARVFGGEGVAPGVGLAVSRVAS